MSKLLSLIIILGEQAKQIGCMIILSMVLSITFYVKGIILSKGHFPFNSLHLALNDSEYRK